MKRREKILDQLTECVTRRWFELTSHQMSKQREKCVHSALAYSIPMRPRGPEKENE